MILEKIVTTKKTTGEVIDKVFHFIDDSGNSHKIGVGQGNLALTEAEQKQIAVNTLKGSITTKEVKEVNEEIII